MASQQQNIQNTGRRTAEQAVSGAREMIEENVGKENLDAFLGMLQPIGDFSIKAMRTTLGYARRHPVRIAFGVIAVGLLSSWLASSKKTEYLH
ncbi:MAG: hypothetical protein ACXVA9_12340 [Bdellovibrionales bacterium]